MNQPRYIYAFFGIQGAGKGTQAKLLAQRLEVPHLSMGDILRACASEPTALGSEVKRIVDAGHLVPDEVVVQIFTQRLQQTDCANGCILDGFARTEKQARELDETLTALGMPLTKAVLIEISEPEIFQRLSSRLSCSACGAVYNLNTNPPKQQAICDHCGQALTQREDDKDRAFIQARIDHYHQSTGQAIEYFRACGKLVIVNGEQSIDEVHQDLLGILGLQV